MEQEQEMGARVWIRCVSVATRRGHSTVLWHKVEARKSVAPADDQNGLFQNKCRWDSLTEHAGSDEAAACVYW